MFQVKSAAPALVDGEHNAMYLGLGTTSRLLRNSRRDDECAGTSKFSYSSEILEKHWEPETEDGGNDWLKDRAAFRLRI
jgi:hypothetical protein